MNSQLIDNQNLYFYPPKHRYPFFNHLFFLKINLDFTSYFTFVPSNIFLRVYQNLQFIKKR